MSPEPSEGSNGKGGSEQPLMVVHVGTHKTGTTSIQDFLWARRGKLEDAGYVYPGAARYGTQHAALPAAFMSDHPILPRTMLQRDPREVLDEILAEVPPRANVILSSEVFWELATYLRPQFAAMVELLAQRWNLVLVYLYRNPHEKAWSSVKHMARQGRAFNPVAAYRADMAATNETAAFVDSLHTASARIPYEGGDSVRRFLQFLASDDISEAAGTTPGQRSVLAEMLRRRSRPSPRGLGNRDYSSPISAAVSLGISELLAKDSPPQSLPIPDLPRLYRALFRVPSIAHAPGIPSEDEIENRIRDIRATSLLDSSDLRSLGSLMAGPEVRVRATLNRCSSTLAAVTQLLN